MVDLNKKCPTGIPGLDELLGGGFPRNRSILLSGSCGTGKTTFAVQFLYNGIVQYNEPGILISLEQDPKELKQDMLSFGFDLSKLEKEGKLAIVDTSLSRVGLASLGESSSFDDSIGLPDGSMSILPGEFNIKKILEIVVSKAENIGAKRVVFDSIPALDFLIKGHRDMKYAVRQVLLALNYRLKLAGLTTLLITETEEDNALSAHGVESYVADGVILLYYTTLGTEAGRSLIIRKMRGTKHSEDVHPIIFQEGVGIEVMNSNEAYKV